MIPPPPVTQSYFQSMQQPVFLPHLLRGNVPTAVPMPQYLNPRMFLQEGMRKIEGKEGEQVNPLAGMTARPEAFMHPTFFYHPGLLFSQPMKMPTQDPPEEKKS